jgi:hypothetical protein
MTPPIQVKTTRYLLIRLADKIGFLGNNNRIDQLHNTYISLGILSNGISDYSSIVMIEATDDLIFSIRSPRGWVKPSVM